MIDYWYSNEVQAAGLTYLVSSRVIIPLGLMLTDLPQKLSFGWIEPWNL